MAPTWPGFHSTNRLDEMPPRGYRAIPAEDLWALFTSSTDEVAGDPQWLGPYRSQAEWVSDVVRWVARRNDVELVIKVHPNLGGNYYIGKATEELRTSEQMRSSFRQCPHSSP